MAFVVVGFYLLLGPNHSTRYPQEYAIFVGMLCIVVFGTFALIGLFRILRPSSLTLTPEGLQIRGLRSHEIYSWNDIDHFFVVSRSGTKAVAFALTAEAKSRGVKGNSRRSLTPGADGGVPSLLVPTPDEVCGLLTEWHTANAG